MTVLHNHSHDMANQIHAALLGHAVGDALGVPVEFCSRDYLKRHPVFDMTGYGTHSQPPGTWSDDTSLVLCTAESLCNGYDLDDMGQQFVRWLFKGHWTPHGQVFDVGQTTREAIFRLDKGSDPREAGLKTDLSNGNGSLMRIAPVGIYFAYADAETRRSATIDCSRLTHGHIRSQLACAFYTELLSRLIDRQAYDSALVKTQAMCQQWIDEQHPKEREAFSRLLDPALPSLKARLVSGSGYVIHCLEASLWACSNSQTYKDTVLKAVNLGDDTDTTAAVAGTLAGLRFGKDSIPGQWIEKIAKIDDMFELYDRFAKACEKRWEAEKCSVQRP